MLWFCDYTIMSWKKWSACATVRPCCSLNCSQCVRPCACAGWSYSDKLSDHNVILGTLKIHIPQKINLGGRCFCTKREIWIIQERCIRLCKRQEFNGYSDNRFFQENFDLMTSFIQESVTNHIPSKSSRSTSSVPWVTPAIRRKIHRKHRLKRLAITNFSCNCFVWWTNAELRARVGRLQTRYSPPVILLPSS